MALRLPQLPMVGLEAAHAAHRYHQRRVVARSGLR